ncbi:MAG TPA: ABC transporter permease, partial [Vicinamibacterales bacterium]
RTSASPVTSFSRGLSYGAGTRRLRTALIVGEVALSTSLLVGTALCLTSLARLHRVPLGFDPDGIAAARVTLPAGAYATPERQQAFFIDVLERLERLPQVSGAAIAFGLPFAADNYVSPYIVAGRPIVPPGERPRAGLRIVTENYLQVMRMRLVTGRFFTASDRTGAPGVCVVNETLARREFAGRSPIGEVLLRGRDADQRFEIVGVVADVKTNGPRQDAPGEVFLPFRQVPRPIGAVTVRSASRPEALAPLLQSVVAAVDPDLPISGFATMDQQINTTIGPDRILAALTSAFGGAALLLAAIGLYAVLAHGVSARTVEIGVRMAVGADRAAILRLIVLGGMRLVATGIAAGLTLAALGARVLEAQLYGISARDPLAYVMVAGLFALVGFTASIVPARRAARVDPIVSLAAS